MPVVLVALKQGGRERGGEALTAVVVQTPVALDHAAHEKDGGGNFLLHHVVSNGAPERTRLCYNIEMGYFYKKTRRVLLQQVKKNKIKVKKINGTSTVQANIFAVGAPQKSQPSCSNFFT